MDTFALRCSSIESSFVRDILKLAAQKDIISFAGGLPDPDLFPTEGFAQAAQEILTNPQTAKAALQYGESAGYAPLREIIARTYQEKENLPISANDIIITTGSQQALDLIVKVFIEKEDPIIVERPTYLAALQAFSLYEPTFVELPLSEGGPTTLPGRSAKLAYLIPNFQNPSGISWSNEARQQFAQWADQEGVIIIEDDPYGEIRFSGTRPKTFRHFTDQAILLGSFSKILAPGLRLGWIVAPQKAIREKLILVKQAADLHSSQFTQLIATKFYEHFDAQRHINMIAKTYGKRKEALRSGLQALFPEADITNPEGGMFLWVHFPQTVDTQELLTFAIAEGVAFVPGLPFYAANPKHHTARFNFSNTDEERIAEGLARLKKAWERYQKSRE